MIVNQNFIISEGYFPDHVCHDIIQSAKNQQEIDGVIQKVMIKSKKFESNLAKRQMDIRLDRGISISNKSRARLEFCFKCSRGHTVH